MYITFNLKYINLIFFAPRSKTGQLVTGGVYPIDAYYLLRKWGAVYNSRERVMDLAHYRSAHLTLSRTSSFDPTLPFFVAVRAKRASKRVISPNKRQTSVIFS